MLAIARNRVLQARSFNVLLADYYDGLEASSRVKYEAVVLRYLEWLRPMGLHPEDASDLEARRFLTWLRDPARGYSPNYIRFQFRVMAAVYRFMASHGVVSVSPFASARQMLKKVESGNVREYQLIDYKLITRIVEAPTFADRRGVRDRAFLALLFYGALRLNEALNLKVDDVRRTPAGTLYVVLRKTKGKEKNKNHAIADEGWSYIQAALDWRLQEGAQGSDWLLPAYYGGPETRWDEDCSRRRFKQYCAAVGAKGVTPHSARATAITKLLEDGVDHRLVQEFSRHSSVQMVEVYDKRRIEIEGAPGRKLSFK